MVLEKETVIGTVKTDDLHESFISYSNGDERYLNSAYAYGGLSMTAKGIVPTVEGSSLVYAFDAGSTNRFRDLLVTFDYSSQSAKGGVAVATSSDGVNFTPFGSVDGVSQSARKNGFSYTAKFRIADEIYGNRKLFVKFIFLNGSVDNIAVSVIRIQTKTTQVTSTDKGTFGFDMDFSSYANYELKGWSDCAINIHDVLVFDKGLGTGRQEDYAGARGYVIWQFEAPEGATIDRLSFLATGRLTKKADTIAHEYAFKLSYSTDGGKTYTDFVSEQISSKTVFSYDLSAAVKGAVNLRLKMTLWGDYWTTVTMKNISVYGAYRYDVVYHAGIGENVENPTSYSSSESDIVLQDAIAPEYYSFEGWYQTADFSGEKLSAIPAGSFGKLDLYARYTPVRYNIIYHLGGGKNAADNDSYYESYAGCALADATRSGYSFRGWYETADFSGARLLSIEAGETRDIELYAKFLKNYRITYVLGGGTLEEKAETFTVEDEVALPVPTREGYTFVGWYTEKSYENQIEKIAYGTENPVTLYAKWNKAPETGSSDSSQSGMENNSNGCKSAVASNAIVGAVLIVFAALKKKKSL